MTFESRSARWKIFQGRCADLLISAVAPSSVAVERLFEHQLVGFVGLVEKKIMKTVVLIPLEHSINLIEHDIMISFGLSPSQVI